LDTSARYSHFLDTVTIASALQYTYYANSCQSTVSSSADLGDRIGQFTAGPLITIQPVIIECGVDCTTSQLINYLLCYNAADNETLAFHLRVPM